MEVNFYLEPDLLGSEDGLHCTSDGFRWVSRRPHEALSLKGNVEDFGHARSSLDSALRLEKVGDFFSPPDRFKKSLVGIPDGTQPKWSWIMPQKEWKGWVRSIVDRLIEAAPSIDDTYYTGAWTHHHTVFSAIKRFASPQPQLFAVDSPEAGTFKPRAGWCERIVYDRFGTRTGRLTVASGPHIQTLRRDARKFLMSRWVDNGILASLDFSALEARVLLAELTGVVPSRDPYEALLPMLGPGFDRNAAKTALISVMYGAGVSGLSSALGVERAAAARVHDILAQAAGVKILVERLRRELASNSFIRNKYHRRVDVPDSSDGVLLNSYVQSTACDVALYGFLEIVKRLDPELGTPVALLHDALIIDCRKSLLEKLGDSIVVPVPGYEGKFLIKITQFNA